MNLFEQARSMLSRQMIQEALQAPGAYWKGDEYITLNPMRNDQNIGSFSINLKTGKFFDFADGTAGDFFDLVAAIRGVRPEDIARSIAGVDNVDVSIRETPDAKVGKPDAMIVPTELCPRDWMPIINGERPPFSLEPTCLTLYSDTATGEGKFYVARWDVGSKGKEIKPIYKSTTGEWVQGLPPSMKGNPRPLLPIDPGKKVVVLEGEKKWHIASSEYEGYSFTAWHGGAQQDVDTSPLRGCDVVFWPDADDVGKAAMLKLAKQIQGIATKVSIVNVPANVEKGWDIADAIREGRDIKILIESATPFAVSEDIDPTGETHGRPYTDLGNAERFIDLFGEQVRFNSDKGTWFVWNKRVWDDRDQSIVSSMYKAVIKNIFDEGSAIARVAANRLQSAARIDAMLRLASRERGVAIREEELDPDPYTLNCQNGVVDLRTGELLPHNPKALHSKITAIEYKKDAKAPRFFSFLNEVFSGNTEIINMIQRWFGYSATGDMSAQVFMIFYGSGANGKSTLVELVSRVLGDYSKPAPPDTFIQKIGGSGIPNDIAALRGARLVTTTETETNAKLAESRVKSMTGGDRVSARYMRGEFFEFWPSWKIVISTNHRPRIQGSDYGIWRRIALVPFDFVAAGDKLDPNLAKTLWEEREGVLNWIVEGAVKWYQDGAGRNGLMIPGTVTVNTQEYREDEDLITRFITQGCLKRGDDNWLKQKTKRITSKELYQAFVRWAEGEGEKYASQMQHTSFSRALSDRGYKSVRGTHGTRYYEGLLPLDMQGI